MLRFTTSFLIAASVALGAGACLDSADVSSDTEALAGEGCFCPANYDPVCGVDGHTYSNTCTAACEHVAVATLGECAAEEPSCFCPASYDPVCGVDGNTYSNTCRAACEHVAVATLGECAPVERPTMCPQVYRPVCGEDGHTYGNACEAGVADAAVAHPGECGAMCGGFAGLSCDDDQKCRYAPSEFEVAPFADAAGTCVSANYCDSIADCTGFPNTTAQGQQACVYNACGWQTHQDAQGTWLAIPGFRFETGHPYTIGTITQTTVTLPADAVSGRFVFEGRVQILPGDTLTISARTGRGAWRDVTALTSTSRVSALSRVELAKGTEYRLRFRAIDRPTQRVSAHGFKVVAEYLRTPN